MNSADRKLAEKQYSKNNASWWGNVQVMSLKVIVEVEKYSSDQEQKDVALVGLRIGGSIISWGLQTIGGKLPFIAKY